jgi:hypothetical protein
MVFRFVRVPILAGIEVILLLFNSNRSRFVRRNILADIAVMLVSLMANSLRDAGNGGIEVTPTRDFALKSPSFFHDPIKYGIALVRTSYRFVSFDVLSGHMPFFGDACTSTVLWGDEAGGKLGSRGEEIYVRNQCHTLSVRVREIG